MKLFLLIFLLTFCVSASLAQNSTFETDFEKNKAKYKLDIYSEGEDASSGSDYLVYKKGAEIVKVREVWSSLSYTTYRIEDFYFKKGKLVAYAKYSFAKKYYNAAKKGTKIPMKLSETVIFIDSKMTGWTVSGKTILKTDARWAETETTIIEKAGYILEGYKTYLEETN